MLASQRNDDLKLHNIKSNWRTVREKFYKDPLNSGRASCSASAGSAPQHRRTETSAPEWGRSPSFNLPGEEPSSTRHNTEVRNLVHVAIMVIMRRPSEEVAGKAPFLPKNRIAQYGGLPPAPTFVGAHGGGRRGGLRKGPPPFHRGADVGGFSR